MAQALVSLDSGSGSIFTIVICPHNLHLQGNARTFVSGSSLRSFPLPHTGHIAHPFTAVIISVFVSFCKLFTPFYYSVNNYPLVYK